jgi:hypothetical protein
VIAENDPAEQEKSITWNSLLCNLIVFHIAIHMMEAIRQLVAEEWQVTAEDLAQLSPYLTSHILGSAPTQPTKSTSRLTCSTPRWTRSTSAANSPRPRSRAR